MLALSIALSFVIIWPMPMGGSVTLLSMLPVMLISVKHGLSKGVSTALLFGVFNLIMGIAKGNVFVYCVTPLAVVICVLFDYLLPFGLLGFAGIFKKKGNWGILVGMALVIVLRFFCHYITGFTIWGQWAAEGQSKYIYSLLYNGQYMLPECIFTLISAGILINIPHIRKLLYNRL